MLEYHEHCCVLCGVSYECVSTFSHEDDDPANICNTCTGTLEEEEEDGRV